MSAPTPLQRLLEELESKVKSRSTPAISANQPNNAPTTALNAPEAASALAKVDEYPPFSAPCNRLLKPLEPPAPSLQLNPEAITHRLTKDLHEHLEPLPAKARALALAFHTAALEAAVRQGMKLRGLSEVALFIPVEAVATSLGIDRVTVWRWFERYPVLRSIIAKREHYGSVTSYTTGELMTWKTGTIWLVKLKPKLEREARVRYEHLKHCWRDLESDIKRGHTARSEAEQGCNHHKDLQELTAHLHKQILKWTLIPSYLQAPLSDGCILPRVPRHELVGLCWTLKVLLRLNVVRSSIGRHEPFVRLWVMLTLTCGAGSCGRWSGLTTRVRATLLLLLMC